MVGLTTDEEIRKKKGYTPELSYEERKEIIDSIRFVDEIVPCTWLIDNDFLIQHNIDLLVHGDDNNNHVPQEKLLIFPRTEGVSSSIMRERVLDSVMALNLNTTTKNNATTKLAFMMIETLKKEFQLD